MKHSKYLSRAGLALLASSTLALSIATAVSPMSVEQGRQLFERNWMPGNPAISSDGLGPLFNGQSCVACHNQGGVGGGGAAEHNALTIGIEEMTIDGGFVNQDVVKQMVRAFHPGFVLPSGTIINTLAMSHHGGSSALAESRAAFLKQLPAEFTREGGPANASEIRSATATPVMFQSSVGTFRMSLRARLFQRNTPSLFGAGLIDQIPDSAILMAAKAQQQHPEISGRPATLRSGKIGKFGWRANVASLGEFTDQACANELGLETNRKPQPTDPMVPAYRNSGIDISDEQIEAMRDFTAALPAPMRDIPSDSKKRVEAERGDALFASVGCAVCHLPNMGPAREIYSDILLHDMGSGLIDLNHAEPYIIRQTPVTRVSLAESEHVSGTQMIGGYYGPATEIRIDRVRGSRSGDFSLSNNRSPVSTSDVVTEGLVESYYGGATSLSASSQSLIPQRFRFRAPDSPSSRMQLVDLAFDDKEQVNQFVAEEFEGVDNARVTRRTLIRETLYKRVHFEPTNFNQEWRTPPLWGVRDSAPYMHDGRAETLLEAISLHGGESEGTRDRFLKLPLTDRHAVLAFLETLAAPRSAPMLGDLRAN
ncbi:Cytochrome c [Rubripirellula tenax]|uniref:Cytochrome c n=1 Tax=Rubripirellula tenax TaxID=2528015 RepID=A0A5C6FHP7_9BACT|nr:di-heme oxidoredictase family protein [Rubripirellula tenax]TWU60335.1 Cytochrome c [Rubripirellula tenax]